MQDSPPALVMPSPEVPAKFSIDRIEKDRALAIVWRQDCSPSRADEIVVCGRDNSRYRLGTALPDPNILMDRLGDKLDLHLGSLEIGSFKDGDYRKLGMRIRF